MNTGTCTCHCGCNVERNREQKKYLLNLHKTLLEHKSTQTTTFNLDDDVQMN